MSDLELTMMRRVGELKAEVERLKKFNDEALAHIAKEERKSRERLDMEQAENARLKAEVHRLEEIVGSDAIDKKYGMCCDASAQVERLIKAGDGLYKSMLEIGCNEMADNFQYDAWWGSMNAWNAAKETPPHA
jgi:hypothetical protein